ncbi:Alpha/Beta hydrolase protein [Podospora appendiculata]|uniref:Alpha/Beta hydrolase protein n=1 Tax=Podospora appendiculata TaxID=314037 RepID=A0AAE0X8V8_9PEZI|nr:Alpha/Beta hydrolase protein [Podospora appendiculata]
MVISGTFIAQAVVDFIHGAYTNNTGPLLNGTTTVEGDFTVHGIYCHPTKPRLNQTTLQILVHGASYDKSMWSGYGFGDDYNWHVKATARGYHTLAIDRLAHGDDKQYLDPFTVVQGTLDREILHQVINILRTDNHHQNPLPKSFQRIIYVGHSYGTIVGIGHANKYPADLDAMVATGFTVFLNSTAIVNYLQLTPAALSSPRFAQLPYGYVTSLSKASRETSFYSGAYDPRIPLADYARRDTLTAGEVGYTSFATPAFGFARPVLLVAGEQDKITCNSPVLRCADILTTTGAVLFPNAAAREVYAPQDTGHDLTLHYSAPETMRVVHDFLDRHFT